MVAVLNDESTVRLGGARYYPASKVYRLSDGSLEVPEGTMGLDGVYTLDSGCYRVMTEEQHAELKRLEAAKAGAVAAAAISSPRARRIAASIEPPSVALAAMAVTPTGCSMHARMATVVAVGPAHIDVALQRARPIMEVARTNNNRVVVVVLGVANESEARAALQIQGEVVMLAGSAELKEGLARREVKGAMRAYLQRASLFECISGSAMGIDGGGNGGAWALPTDPVPLDGSLAALVTRGDRSLAQWKDELNTQWKDWYTRFDLGSAPLDAKDSALLRAYTSFPSGPVPPLSGLGEERAIGIVGNANGPPFGRVDHTLYRRDGWPDPRARWSSTSGVGASVYWTVTTWCGNTRAALRVPQPVADRQVDQDDIQYAVNTTLASLTLYMAPGGMQPFRTRFDDLRGQIGPVVAAGRDGDEPLRVTWWTLPDRTSGVVMLLPDVFVRTALIDYSITARGGRHDATIAAQGFLVLSDADAVPLQFTGVTQTEHHETASYYGNRLWIPNGATAREAVGTGERFASVVDAATALAAFHTQLDVDSDMTGYRLRPGQRVKGANDLSVFYTSTTSEDHLCGLRVRWVLAPGGSDLPTLDVDNGPGGAQTPYEK